MGFLKSRFKKNDFVTFGHGIWHVVDVRTYTAQGETNHVYDLKAWHCDRYGRIADEGENLFFDNDHMVRHVHHIDECERALKVSIA